MQQSKESVRLRNTLLISGFIAIAVVMFLAIPACDKDSSEKETSETISANSTGTVLFMHSRIGENQANLPDSCVFTTNLPAPNEKFTLRVDAENNTAKKIIGDLQAAQKIEWKTIVEGNPVNIGSEIGEDHFVHIVNE